MENLLIIGSGPAGLTAAIYASRANLNPILLSGSLIGGLLTQTSDVENFPGFPEGVTGIELMEKMQEQAEKFGTRIEYDWVDEFQLTDGGTQKVILSSGETIEAKAIILATGASPRYLGLPSEEKLRNRGVSACATCDGALYANKDVVVVGGGDSAMEEAMFLSTLTKKVYLIHRRNEFRASKIMVQRVKENQNIELVLDANVVEVLGEEKVTGVRVKYNDFSEREIACEAYFVALGHVPSTSLFKDFINLDSKGYVETKNSSTETNFKGVFVAGDCADPCYRQAINAAASGCRAAMDVEKYLNII